MTLNLEEMSLHELKDLKVRINKALITVEDRERKAALAAVDEVVRQHGFHSYADLLARGRKPSQPAAGLPRAAKYRNPIDENQTWSGRGRHPQWVSQALAEGRALSELLIEPPTTEVDASERPVRGRKRSGPADQSQVAEQDAA